ncbi:competence protein ComN [Bacillus obstructivus]|nr:competence protein ComN [Bacillus obstructivus]
MREAKHIYDQYFGVLEPALKSKAEEFELIGYGKIETRDLWNFLKKKIWKRRTEDIHMHELVSDVLAIKIGDFMNFTTVEAYRTTSWNIELNEEELQALLHTKADNL